VPKDKPKKKRGGRRFRKLKEKFRISEMQKQKNRMVFGGESQTDDYTGESFGMLGVAAGVGVQRVKAKTKARKVDPEAIAMRKRIKATTTNTSGLASTISFTPLQGMELVNPRAAAEKAADSHQRYFSNTAGFKSEIKRSSLPPVPKWTG
jgi:U4/U6 small nuclear ribonucleoprotein PRP31